MALPSSGQLGGTPTNAEFQGYIEAFRDVVSNQLGGAGRTELTIASGSVTPPARDHGGVLTIDTEGNAASDALDTVALTNIPDGAIILLQAENAARVVTLTHAAGGSGQMLLRDGANFTFSSEAAWVAFQRRSTDLVEIARDVPVEDLVALATGPLEASDLLRIWDDSAGREKKISAKASAALAGLVELATSSEALGGVDTERAVTSAGLATDQTKANAGHIVLPGGILIAWGRAAFAGGTGPVTITYSRAFGTTPYAISIGHNLGNIVTYLSSNTSTNCAVTAASSATGTVYVIAIGTV